VPISLKSGSLKLLEPSGSVQVCNWIGLPFLIDCYVGTSISEDAVWSPFSTVKKEAMNSVETFVTAELAVFLTGCC
jgi:hypothetical protein